METAKLLTYRLIDEQLGYLQFSANVNIKHPCGFLGKSLHRKEEECARL